MRRWSTLTVAGVGAGTAVTFWPRRAGDGSTCDGTDTCGKNQRRPKPTVTLNTGALISAPQTTSPWEAAGTHAYLADSAAW